jgi:hypothetical protein
MMVFLTFGGWTCPILKMNDINPVLFLTALSDSNES